MKKLFSPAVAALALAVAFFAPTPEAKAQLDTEINTLNLQLGLAFGQAAGSVASAYAGAGEAVADASSTNLVNAFVNDVSQGVSFHHLGSWGAITSGINTVTVQLGAVGYQSASATANATGYYGATATASALNAVNVASNKVTNSLVGTANCGC